MSPPSWALPIGWRTGRLALTIWRRRPTAMPAFAIDGNHDGTLRCDSGAFEFGFPLFLPLIVR